MKDCTTCKKRPAPGADYRKTACARCQPWEPQDDKATVQVSLEFFDTEQGRHGRVNGLKQMQRRDER